jgi:hypothetical protein
VAVPEYSLLPSLIFAIDGPISETDISASGRSCLLAKNTLPGIVWPDVTMWAEPTLGPKSIFKLRGDIIGSVWTLNNQDVERRLFRCQKRRKNIEGNQISRGRCNVMLKMAVCHDISRCKAIGLTTPRLV